MHTFHIPVLGLGYSIDTPLKVARYGISSVVSIVDDELTERMREYHCRQNGVPYQLIRKDHPDSRVKRITAYLNLLNELVDRQFNELKKQPFYADSDLDKYFDLLPEESQLKQGYELMREFTEESQRNIFAQILRRNMTCGAIDVNIMTKVDKMNLDANGQMISDSHTDALLALRGFAESNLSSSVVLSAGLNQRLFAYLENFPDFYPDEFGLTKKKVILKVSDYRSALLQAKLLAKKGIWVSEFRIESGLNCGGHAFATDGLLLGPILEEFKQNREVLRTELFVPYQSALIARGLAASHIPLQRITVQGGIGTAAEHRFLLQYYHLDAAGWGSPFLLVPEATNVDDETLFNLSTAKNEDFYLSDASPLGVLFNNFSKSSAHRQKLERIAKDRPGSPCTKKLLVNNTEFTDTPICTASRQYQALKIAQIKGMDLPEEELQCRIDTVTEKLCLCEGLCASVYIKDDLLKKREDNAVVICPGPNIAYFDSIYSLSEMSGHIYGKLDLLTNISRPHVFINELKLYMDYLRNLSEKLIGLTDNRQLKYLQKFRIQLAEGITYYKRMFADLTEMTWAEISTILDELSYAELELAGHAE